MLRMPTLQELMELNDRFDHIVMHAAKAAECEATIESLNGYMPLYDDPVLGGIHKKVVKLLAPDAPFDENSTFLASCTDMGDVATVKKSQLVTKLIRLKDRSFYDVVNMKFKIG